MIHLNVGGTNMYARRETLTKIKGSRLEVLFSGRWEDKLLRDEQGRVFLDMDIRYFKKIVDHLHSMVLGKDNDNKNNQVSNWPKLSDETEQKMLELYIDLFHLRQEAPGTTKDNSTRPSIAKKPKNNNNNEGPSESCQDLLEAVKNEAQELDDVEEKLKKMEKDIEEEEEFVSFFTTDHPQAQVQESEKEPDYDSDNSISFTSCASDLCSIASSTYQQQNDNTRSPIVNLWIGGEIISTKRSTLCDHKDSLLAENFNDISWVNKHILTTKDGKEVVLMGYSSMMLSIINQLRLRSMMVAADDLPGIPEVNIVKLVENIVSTIFPGMEDFVLGKMKSLLDSKEIVTLETERHLQEKMKEEEQKEAEAEAHARAEEERRLVREKEKPEKIKKELELLGKKNYLKAMERNVDAMTEVELTAVNVDALTKEYAAKVAKKKDDTERNFTREVQKNKMDYFVRAIRIEEVPLIKKQYEERLEEAKARYEADVVEKLRRAKLQWEEDCKSNAELNSFGVFRAMKEFEKAAMVGRTIAYKAACVEEDINAEKTALKAKMQRARKRKEAKIHRLKEAEERLRKEKERRKVKLEKQRRKEERRRKEAEQETNRKKKEIENMVMMRERDKQRASAASSSSRNLGNATGTGRYIPPPIRGGDGSADTGTGGRYILPSMRGDGSGSSRWGNTPENAWGSNHVVNHKYCGNA